MKNYLGLGLSPHDTSLAIVDPNGELVLAEGAERPLQSKRAWGVAPDHIDYLNEYIKRYCDPGLATVVGSTWSKNIARRYWLALPYVKYRINRSKDHHHKDLLTFKYMAMAHESVLNLATAALEFGYSPKRRMIERLYFDHHLTHAAASAYASPYDDGVCVVIDGFGEKGAIAAFEFREGKLRKIKGVESYRQSSLGLFYALVCDTCGFDPMKGEEWKVMGLAAYGKFDPRLYDLIRPLVRMDGLTLRGAKNYESIRKTLYDMRRKPPTPALEYADFAATAQCVFTETVHELLRNIYEIGISENLILSGGCALNSSTNGTIVEHTPFKELFVGSAPADDGNAIGAALLAYYSENSYTKRRDGVLTPYLGSAMRESSVARLKKYCGVPCEELSDDALIDFVARALADGKIVGWVQGKAEFGPRALGNRSILADPRKKGVREKINADVKFREEFRPFAPSVLHEYGDVYFERYQFSPYMERTLKFKASASDKVAGVVHVDGTGRLQSVTTKLNSRYHKLISAFNNITGVPLLLNTSFNVMGKPIVHSAEDAIAVFQTSGLDLLVIDNFIFSKSRQMQLGSESAPDRVAALA
jgi:carbamoyltransferase